MFGDQTPSTIDFWPNILPFGHDRGWSCLIKFEGYQHSIKKFSFVLVFNSRLDSRVSNMFDQRACVPRLLSGLCQLFDLCLVKHVLTVWTWTNDKCLGPKTIKHCLVTKHADVEVSGQTVKMCLIKHRSNNWYKPLSKCGTHARFKHLWYAAVQTNKRSPIKHENKRNVLSCPLNAWCLQILSNTTKHDQHIQTRSNSTKQGVQTVKCLVTKLCLMVFGRQTALWSLTSPNNSCGSSRPFAHRKVRLYPWEVCVLCVTSIPTVKLPMGTSKRTKELPMPFPEPSRRV